MQPALIPFGAPGASGADANGAGTAAGGFASLLAATTSATAGALPGGDGTVTAPGIPLGKTSTPVAGGAAIAAIATGPAGMGSAPQGVAAMLTAATSAAVPGPLGGDGTTTAHGVAFGIIEPSAGPTQEGEPTPEATAGLVELAPVEGAAPATADGRARATEPVDGAAAGKILATGDLATSVEAPDGPVMQGGAANGEALGTSDEPAGQTIEESGQTIEGTTDGSIGETAAGRAAKADPEGSAQLAVSVSEATGRDGAGTPSDVTTTGAGPSGVGATLARGAPASASASTGKTPDRAAPNDGAPKASGVPTPSSEHDTGAGAAPSRVGAEPLSGEQGGDAASAQATQQQSADAPAAGTPETPVADGESRPGDQHDAARPEGERFNHTPEGAETDGGDVFTSADEADTPVAGGDAATAGLRTSGGPAGHLRPASAGPHAASSQSTATTAGTADVTPHGLDRLPAAGGGVEPATPHAHLGATAGGNASDARADAARTASVAARVEQAFEAGLERGLAGRLRDNGEMRLAVRQEGLGDLDVRVTVRESGVHASIGTQHDEARQLLNSQRADLEAALQRYNLRLDSFNVDVGHQDGRSGMRHEDAQGPSRHGESSMSVRHADPAAAVPNPHRAGGLSIRA